MPVPLRSAILLDGLPFPVRQVFQRGNIQEVFCALCGSKSHSLHGCPGSSYEQRSIAASWVLRRWSLLVAMELTSFAHMTPGAYVRSRVGLAPTLSHKDIVEYVNQVTASNDPNPFDGASRRSPHTQSNLPARRRKQPQRKGPDSQRPPAQVPAQAPASSLSPILQSPPGPAATTSAISKHVSRYPPSDPNPQSVPPSVIQLAAPLTLKPIGSSKGSNAFANFLGPAHRPQRVPDASSTSQAAEDRPRA